jgi:hypothetical protein
VGEQHLSEVGGDGSGVELTDLDAKGEAKGGVTDIAHSGVKDQSLGNVRGSYFRPEVEDEVIVGL